MKHISSVDQLRALLQSKKEEKLLAAFVANLYPESADQFCLMCVAYLRFQIRPVSNNAMLYACVCNFLNMIEVNREKDTMQVSWAINPAIMALTQIESPDSYEKLMFMDSSISKEEADSLMKSLGI